MSFNEFLQMGGYAVYVWSSVGLTLLLLVWNILVPVWQGKQQIKRIRKIQSRADI